MRKGLSRFALLAAAVLSAGVLFAEGSDVLYWMVDNNAEITTNPNAGTTTTVGDFFANIKDYYPDLKTTAEGSAFAARVRVTGGDIQEGQDVFLDLYIPGYGLDVGGGEYGVEFSDVGGYWGAGVPTGNQSPSGDYSSGTPEYNFIVELGNIDGNDNWTTVAQSAASKYSDLGDFIHQTFDINPSSMAVWTPTSFAVPEPSSGLLTLLGFAFLALRRKRKGA